MKRFLRCGILTLFLAGTASAQTVTPPRPVDPNQVLPPESTNLPSPVPPPPLGAPSPDSTNADATPAAPVALTVVAESSLKQVLQELAQNWADSLDTSPQVPLTLTNSERSGARWRAARCGTW